MKTEQELLEYLNQNERKQKQFTIKVALAFSILVVAILVLTVYALNQRGKNIVLNGKLINAEYIIKQQDSLLKAQNENARLKNDSVQNAVTTDRNIKMFDTISLKAFEGKKITVFIQTDKTNKEKAVQLHTSLPKTEYKLPAIQKIYKTKFVSSIRYFHPEDSLSAMELQAKVKTLIGDDITVKRMSLSSPRRQIEVWLGEASFSKK